MDTDVQATENRIFVLIQELPPESLPVVEQFVRFLNEQAQNGQPVVTKEEKEERPPYKYPTIPVPAAAIEGLIGIMPSVGGDALADTEALYDDV